MCGATSAQNTLQTEQTQFYQQAQQEQSTVYGEDQDLLAKMESVYEPILNAGPNQKGFSQAEDNNLNTQAVEGTAENYSAAAKAVGEETGAAGGGDTYLPSGGATQLKEETANSAASQESSEESQIQQADYAQGYNEWQTAAEGLSGVASDLSPTAYSTAATNAGSAASTTANDIAQENNSWINAAIGAAGTIGGAAVGDFSFGSSPAVLNTTGGADPLGLNAPSLPALPSSFSSGPAPTV